MEEGAEAVIMQPTLGKAVFGLGQKPPCGI